MKRSKTLFWIGVLAAVVLVALIYRGASAAWQGMNLSRAKDPGLGVRALHAQGVTGKGISVAIIDGQIRTDHVEYRDQLVHYEELSNFEGIPYEAHGPMVASLLVGKDTGVAPGAQLYYFAQNFAEASPYDTAEALRHILAFNQDLPEGQRIRIVSISNGWSDHKAGVDEFEAAVEDAWGAGVVVINSQTPTLTHPPLAVRMLGCPPLKDCEDPQNYTLSSGLKEYLRGKNQSMQAYLGDRVEWDRDNGYVSLYVPGHHRTVAGPRQGMGAYGYGPKEYFYNQEGGLSVATPYLGGVLALALQTNPGLMPGELVPLLAEGVYELENGVRLIAPEKIVQLAQSQ